MRPYSDVIEFHPQGQPPFRVALTDRLVLHVGRHRTFRPLGRRNETATALRSGLCV
jgi:hypothetical protein